VRKLFTDPEVKPASEVSNLTWKPADLEGLVQYLVHEKQFSEERVRSAVDKMNAAKGKASQNRLESFFKVRMECRMFHAGCLTENNTMSMFGVAYRMQKFSLCELL
jgi:hypothetical protein